MDDTNITNRAGHVGVPSVQQLESTYSAPKKGNQWTGDRVLDPCGTFMVVGSEDQPILSDPTEYLLPHGPGCTMLRGGGLYFDT